MVQIQANFTCLSFSGLPETETQNDMGIQDKH